MKTLLAAVFTAGVAGVLAAAELRCDMTGYRATPGLEARLEKLVPLGWVGDPLLDIAKHLEEAALNDPYFIERKLYPNVDFYSGIIMRAIGIPLEMFTVIFAIGRMPGWIANYREVMEDNQSRIYRPRQIYTGPKLSHYTPLKERK